MHMYRSDDTHLEPDPTVVKSLYKDTRRLLSRIDSCHEVVLHCNTARDMPVHSITMLYIERSCVCIYIYIYINDVCMYVCIYIYIYIYICIYPLL